MVLGIPPFLRNLHIMATLNNWKTGNIYFILRLTPYWDSLGISWEYVECKGNAMGIQWI